MRYSVPYVVEYVVPNDLDSLHLEHKDFCNKLAPTRDKAKLTNNEFHLHYSCGETKKNNKTPLPFFC